MAEALQIDRWDVGGSAWLVLAGELDRIQVERSAPRMRALCRGPVLVLDLRRLTFVDLGGLRFLVRLIDDAQARGARVRAILSEPVRHLAEATDVTEVLAAAAEPEEVLASGGPPGVAAPRVPPPGLGGPARGVAPLMAAALRLDVEEAIARTHAIHLRSAYLARRGRRAAGHAEEILTAAWDARELRERSPEAADEG